MKKLIWMFLFLVAFSACSSDDEQDGTVPPNASGSESEEVLTGGNSIDLSLREVAFNWREDTVLVTTGGEGWYIDSIIVDSNIYVIPDADRSKHASTGLFEITCDWITLKCEGKEMLLIANSRNFEIKERSFVVYLHNGDNTDVLKGTQEQIRDGDWDDMIGLSSRSVSFGNHCDTVCIQTRYKTGWWFASVNIDGKMYMGTLEEWEQQIAGKFRGVYDWLTIDYDDGTIMMIADTNNGPERRFVIDLEAGNYFDSITGVQSGAPN